MGMLRNWNLSRVFQLNFSDNLFSTSFYSNKQMRALPTPRNEQWNACIPVCGDFLSRWKLKQQISNKSEWTKSKGKNTKPPAREGAHPLLGTKTRRAFVCVPRLTKIPINKMPWVRHGGATVCAPPSPIDNSTPHQNIVVCLACRVSTMSTITADKAYHVSGLNMSFRLLN